MPARLLRRVLGHHEDTITVGMDTDKGRRYFNIPTVVKGKKMSNSQAVEHFKKRRKHFGSFKTLKEAVGAAELRSKQAGEASRTRHPPRGRLR